MKRGWATFPYRSFIIVLYATRHNCDPILVPSLSVFAPDTPVTASSRRKRAGRRFLVGELIVLLLGV